MVDTIIFTMDQNIHFYKRAKKLNQISAIVPLRMMMKDRSDENNSNLFKKKIILHQKRRD